MTTIDQPWLKRRDWASGRITDSTLFGVFFLWIFAIIWNGIIALILLAPQKHSSHHSAPPIWFFGIFLAVGALVLWLAAYTTLSRLKYGKSVFELQTLPAVPGGVLAGTVRIARPFLYRDPIHLNLGQYRLTQQGKNSTDVMEWQDACTLDRFSENQAVSEIPVYFKIPADAKICDRRAFGGRISWRLDIKARTAGVHYSSSFQIPVFNAPIAPETLNLPDPTVSLRSPQAKRQQPLDRFIHMTPLVGGGCKIEFAARHNAGMATFLFLFGLTFTGFGIGASVMGAPALFPFLFIPIGAIVAICGLRLMLLKLTVTARHGLITVDRALPLFATQKQIRAADIADIVTSMQGSMGNTPLYSIKALRSETGSITLCGLIRGKNDADWLTAEIKKAISMN